jgi:FAD/FMN-containing dehydrogenase
LDLTTMPGLVRPPDQALDDFAALVGREEPVCVSGGRTQWLVGGPPAPGTREVEAPGGVVSHQPEEMIVRVRAGTTVAALEAHLAGSGQMVPLDPAQPERATVGGVLAVGHSGHRRLRYGPLRDTVLEVRFVTAGGDLVTAGAPVVKNVTGYDLARLMVASLGTLGLLAEVVLRCYPVPSASRWLRSRERGAADPFDLLRRLYRTSSILWDGANVWVLLEGHPDDVAAQADDVLGSSFCDVPMPPVAPGPDRMSLAPGQIRQLPATGAAWLAQVGVGSVSTDDGAGVAGGLGLPWPPAVEPRIGELHRVLKCRFDPAGRLNPGRRVT